MNEAPTHAFTFLGMDRHDSFNVCYTTKTSELEPTCPRWRVQAWAKSGTPGLSWHSPRVLIVSLLTHSRLGLSSCYTYTLHLLSLHAQACSACRTHSPATYPACCHCHLPAAAATRLLPLPLTCCLLCPPSCPIGETGWAQFVECCAGIVGRLCGTSAHFCQLCGIRACSCHNVVYTN
jgi:hypothetical protein